MFSVSDSYPEDVNCRTLVKESDVHYLLHVVAEKKGESSSDLQNGNQPKTQICSSRRNPLYNRINLDCDNGACELSREKRTRDEMRNRMRNRDLKIPVKKWDVTGVQSQTHFAQLGQYGNVLLHPTIYAYYCLSWRDAERQPYNHARNYSVVTTTDYDSTHYA